MGRQAAALCGSVHSNDRDRQAISYHYDLAPEFFALWLDQRMMYSCAYFATGKDTDLDTVSAASWITFAGNYNSVVGTSCWILAADGEGYSFMRPCTMAHVFWGSH